MKNNLKRMLSSAAALTVAASTASAIPSADFSLEANAASNVMLEYLDRGISAVNTGKGMLVSWRFLANDADDATFVLYRNNTEIYRSKSGDDFTPIKQRVIKKVATPDESLHGKVAESLSCGYSYNGRTISAEKITVYYYEKPVEENENSEVIENG